MRSLVALAPALAAVALATAALPPDTIDFGISRSARERLYSRHEDLPDSSHHDLQSHEQPPPPDEHAHSHDPYAVPLLQINETDILLYHIPTPPSYGTHDFDDPDVEHKYPGLMTMHAILMGSAFFLALPIGIALRSVNHACHGLSVAAFYALSALGVSASALYSKLTPNMYEGATHAAHGYLVLLLALALSALDVVTLLRRALRFAAAVRVGKQQFGIRAAWRAVALGRNDDDTPVADAGEYVALVAEPHESGVQELKTVDVETHGQQQQPEQGTEQTARWAHDMRRMHQQHRQRGSEWRQSAASDGTLWNNSHRGSDDTLHDVPPSPGVLHQLPANISLLHRVGRGTFATLERILVFLGYAQVLTGIVTYTGVCRDSYVNGCLAHLIKGGIFWCYGLVTFARFLGAFSENGWAWNRAPRRAGGPSVSAEFVESLVIFIYGVTNTWMERFGVAPGTPYSTKEVQHISIDVMFWFAGIVGMGIESRRVRRWLAAPAALATPSGVPEATDLPSEPLQYSVSLNPFPALVIGVTGAAMAAHAQVYRFQVQIHVLWGALLLAFAALRCTTYFFLWLAPPRASAPARPPTEALASFFLACGGLMFQLSTEELTLAAMRRGHDDEMMFLNVAVAVTFLAFCWTLGIVAFKGWLKYRLLPSGAFSGTA